MKLIVFIGLLLLLLVGGCSPGLSFDSKVGAIARPYSFSGTSWELSMVPDEIYRQINRSDKSPDDEIQTVIQYFSKSSQSDAATTIQAEKIIEKQIRDTLTQLGIFNPVIGLRINFPPVDFSIQSPPHLLVISPKDKIESIKEVTLKPNLTLKEMKEIESKVDELGFSSIVVELGGLGATFPTFVSNEADLRFTIDAAIEEWLHQYLVFKPLGFRYLLDVTGISRNYDISVMNETVASMTSKEIGSILYEKYYSNYESDSGKPKSADSGLDFNLEMREIRKTVDSYLAQGRITDAEKFMIEKRQYLASMGYNIRKLNQAYFAFYGTYADSPTSVNPIGAEVKALREQSPSLKDFLNNVAGMTSSQELAKSIK